MFTGFAFIFATYFQPNLEERAQRLFAFRHCNEGQHDRARTHHLAGFYTRVDNLELQGRPFDVALVEPVGGVQLSLEVEEEGALQLLVTTRQREIAGMGAKKVIHERSKTTCERFKPG